MRRARAACGTWTLAIAGICIWAATVDTQPARQQLLLVIDGLRPDYVTAAIMPRLQSLGQRGIVFTAHHSIFPTVTRVNSSSIATGAYPETHGLLGNTVFSARMPPKGIDTANFEELEAMEKAEGALLTSPTLSASLNRAGKKLVVVSAGSTGSALLLNHPLYDGAIINPDLIQPPSLASRIVSTIGPGPAEAVPNNARNKWAVDAYLNFVVKNLQPEVAAIWFGDPDATAHAQGIGSETTLRALRSVDAEIGRIEDTLRSTGLLDRTNIMVISDHGFSTHTGELRLPQLVAPFARTLPDGSADIIVTEGAVNFRGPRDPARIAAVVAALQRRPEVGAIFTRPDVSGSMKGAVAGTLSFNVPRWNHARSAEILVSANWNGDRNDAGFAGKTTQGGVAGHGTSSPYDVHNTFLAFGPDFREHATSAVPTANADIAPTILKLLQLPIPPTMTGRPVVEAFRAGPAIGGVKIERRVETAQTADSSYKLDAHTSIVDGHRYFDYTEVHRPPASPVR